MNDLDVFHRLNGDEEIVRYIRAPKTYEECRSFLEQVIGWYADSPVNWRVGLVSETEQVVGSFAIIPIGTTTELQLGYSFLPEHWGKGYATEITREGARYAFDVLGLDSIAAITDVSNIASQNVLLKCGFILEREYEEGGKRLFRYRLKKTGDRLS